MQSRSSRKPVAANAQQEPQAPWLRTEWMQLGFWTIQEKEVGSDKEEGLLFFYYLNGSSKCLNQAETSLGYFNPVIILSISESVIAWKGLADSLV